MSDSLSYWFARNLEIASRLFFALTIVFAPLRWRIILWERPTFPIYGDYTDFLLYASDITLIYTLIFWGCALILAPRSVSLGYSPASFSLAGLTLAGFVSVVGGEDIILSQYQSLRLILLFLFYLYFLNAIPSWKWIIIPVGLQVFLQSLVAIGQSLFQHAFGLQAFGERTLDPNTTGVSVILANGLRFLRAYGLTDHPNILGGCLAFGLVILLAVILYGRTLFRWLAAVPFLMGLLALVMTFSRSGWVGFLVGSSLMVGLEAILHHWDAVRRVAMIGLVSVFIVAPFVIENSQFFGVRFNAGGSFKQASFENQSLGERMLLIHSGNRIFVEHPATGVGLGASPLALQRRFPDFETNYQPPHFTLLAAAMETGVIGAVFYLVLLVTPVIVFMQSWKSFAKQPYRVVAIALLFTVMVVGFFDYYTWLNAAGRIWQWLAWGLWSSAMTKVA